MTLTDFTRIKRKKKRSAGPLLSGAGSLSIFGTGRVTRYVNAVLAEDPWARDAANLSGDFSRALERANLDR